MHEMAYGQQRLVEMAIALAQKPKVLLLDEPTAGIPSGETELITDAIERLPQEICVLLIEHDMALVRRFAREVTVLVHGSVLISGTVEAVMSADEVRKVYLGEVLGNHFEARQSTLELCNIVGGWGPTTIVEDVSLIVEPGETVAIVGRNGVGRSTLLEIVTSRATLRARRIVLSGQDVTSLRTHDRARRGLGYVPQQREIFPSLSVNEHLTIAQPLGSTLTLRFC